MVPIYADRERDKDADQILEIWIPVSRALEHGHKRTGAEMKDKTMSLRWK